MKLLGGVVVLACENIDAMIAFYQRALQFVVVKQQQQDNSTHWAQLQSGDVMLMLQHESTKAARSPRLFFYVDDAPGLHHYLSANQFYPGALRETPYGLLEFDLQDPAGHAITMGQRLSSER